MSMEEELYRQLDGDGGKTIIFKMARNRAEDGRGVKRGAVSKDNNGRLTTESKEVLRIWAANFKELLNVKGAASCLELPSSVRREVEVEEIRQEEMEANAWRAVEGVMADRRISKRLKGKVMSTCVTPACLYGTETLALTELQQQRLQVCENNWVRKIARVTRADRRRMVELREETGYRGA